MTLLYVKNMVCDRCIMAVKQALDGLSMAYQKVELGEVFLENKPSDEQLILLKNRLKELGFELLDDKKHQVIEQIKAALIKEVRYNGKSSGKKMSDYLSGKLHQDYSSLSKLFSEVEGKTLEHYLMELKIERVKELIKYDELTLSQIANMMDYSSTAHLSAQFKSITGMTPTQFKKLESNTRKGLDKL